MQARKGFGLIEIIIAASIIGTAMVSLSYVLVLSNRLSSRSNDKIRANFIAEEGLEAMRFLRDKSWSNISSPGNYYVSINTTTGVWSISPTNPGALDSTFTRTIRVSTVNRDNDYNIVSTGGTTDTGTLKITSTVAWANESLSVSTYLSNIFNN